MTTETVETTVEILGRPYQVRCPADEVNALEKAARYLDEKMTELLKGGNTTCLDRVAVIAALNVTHQLLTIEYKNERYLQSVNQRLMGMQNKLEAAVNQSQLELDVLNAES